MKKKCLKRKSWMKTKNSRRQDPPVEAEQPVLPLRPSDRQHLLWRSLMYTVRSVYNTYNSRLSFRPTDYQLRPVLRSSRVDLSQQAHHCETPARRQKSHVSTAPAQRQAHQPRPSPRALRPLPRRRVLIASRPPRRGIPFLDSSSRGRSVRRPVSALLMPRGRFIPPRARPHPPSDLCLHRDHRDCRRGGGPAITVTPRAGNSALDPSAFRPSLKLPREAGELG